MAGLGLDALPPQLSRKWAAARVWAAHRMPYLANAVLTLDPVVIPDTPLTGGGAALHRLPADTGWHLHLSLAELDRQSVPELGFWVLHQLTHLLRKHAERFPDGYAEAEQERSETQLRWNLAADAESAGDVKAAEGGSPAGLATASALGLPADRLAETYYEMLGTRAPVAGDPLAAGDCGTGCDGRPRVWNCDWPAVSRTTAQLTALDAARRIREHQRTRDDVPGGWRRWADEVLDPVVDWRREFAAHLRRAVADTAGRVDFSYRKPSRRSAALPEVILPSLRQPLPTVAVVIDTSASVSDDMLGQCLAEVNGVLRAVGVGRDRLTTISVDARVYRAQQVRSVEELRLGGGGGTDLRVGIEAAAALKPAPDLIIVLTDGHTPWPERPPARTRILVGLLDPDGRAPDWASTVLISDDS